MQASALLYRAESSQAAEYGKVCASACNGLTEKYMHHNAETNLPQSGAQSPTFFNFVTSVRRVACKVVLLVSAHRILFIFFYHL